MARARARARLSQSLSTNLSSGRLMVCHLMLSAISITQCRPERGPSATIEIEASRLGRTTTRLDSARVEWSGVEWSGVEWSGVEWSGVEWSGVEWRQVDPRAQASRNLVLRLVS